VAKVRERMAVNKHKSHSLHMERFLLKKLNVVEGKEKNCIEISNMFENLDAKVEFNSAWKTIRINIKISARII
jgi:hypothetical protein